MNFLQAMENEGHKIEEVVSALRGKVASLQTTDNEKHVAFEIVTGKWNGLASEAEGLLADFTDVEGDGKDALVRVKAILSELKGSTSTVLQLGLNNLPDAVKAPVNNGDAPAVSPSLTLPVQAEDVKLNEDKKVVAEAKPTENVVNAATSIVKRAVDVVADEVKTGIQNDTNEGLTFDGRHE